MDQNRDGFIDKEDLKDTYASLGMCPGGRTPAQHPDSPALRLQSQSLAPLLGLIKPDLTSRGLWGGGGLSWGEIPL